MRSTTSGLLLLFVARGVVWTWSVLPIALIGVGGCCPICRLELAGPNHYKYLDEVFYYYYLTRNKFKASEKAIDKWNSYTITPYEPLKDLEEEGRKVQNYEVPEWILKRKKKVEADVLNEKLDEKHEEAVDKKYFQLEMHGGP